MLVLNTKKIYMHLPKMAGTTVIYRCIAEYPQNIDYWDMHCPYKFLPATYENYELIGTIRNPITWYSSYYYFYKQQAVLRNSFMPFIAEISFLMRPNPKKVIDNKNFVSFDEFLERALFFDEFMNIYHDLIFNYLLNVTTDNTSLQRKIFSPLSIYDSSEFQDKSLLQYLYGIYGFKFAKIFRIEDQLKDCFFELTGDKNMAQKSADIYIKKTIRKRLPNSDQMQKIYDKDKYIFKKHNYSYLETI